MTLQIALTADEEAKLRERAAALGQDVLTFVRQAALEKAERPTLSDLLAPIHEDTRRRAITVEEVDEAVEQARREYHRERGTRDPGQNP
jgi:hypothetical protein